MNFGENPLDKRFEKLISLRTIWDILAPLLKRSLIIKNQTAKPSFLHYSPSGVGDTEN